MTTIILLLILILPGQEPKMKQFPMPNLEHCMAAATAFLSEESEEVNKVLEKGGIRQAGCSVVSPPPGPRA